MKGRDIYFFLSSAVLANILLLSVPALFSCSSSFETDEREPLTKAATLITLKSDGAVRNLDIFFFDSDSGQTLDSYQRIDTCTSSYLTGSSTTGKKRLVILANAARDRYEWSGISTYESLEAKRYNLGDEDPDYPVMSGECDIECGSKNYCKVTLEPLTSRVVLNSISCDFHSRPYRGAVLEDVRVYLTNVSGRASLMERDTSLTESIVNSGGLSDTDMESFLHKEMVCSSIEGQVGMNVISPGIRLYCYPNTNKEEGPGTPFTRLVVEGKIDGETWYWPIDINREGFGYVSGLQGICRNKTYSIDLTLTRYGTSDPDMPAETGSFTMDSDIAPWKDKGGKVTTFSRLEGE